MAKDFSAQVDAWVLKSRKRMLAVFKESTQRVAHEMRIPVGGGGNMPVDTGFLRASLLGTINVPTAVVTYNPGTRPAPDTAVAQFALVIAQAELGDTIYGTFTANYAMIQEYGSAGRTGRGFVRKAAQKWQMIVDEVVNEAKARNP